MSDAFSLAWAFLKQDEEEEEEEQTQQMSLLDFNKKPAQPKQGAAPNIVIPPAFGGQVAENLFDADGNLIMPEPTAAAPETVQPVAVKQAKLAPGVGVAKPKAKEQVERVPYTDPRTGKTRMVDKVQRIAREDMTPVVVPKRSVRDPSTGVYRNVKTEPKESPFARAKREEAEKGLSREEEARRTAIVEGDLKDLTDSRIINTGGATGEKSRVKVGEKHHWLSPQPCQLCGSTFKDYTKGKQKTCTPCRAAAKKGDKALNQRLEKLRKNPNHPINSM